ncbi:MFS transporter [Lipingzhangella sp. LS1_29]|uniref:MFS transporter n=1 Tax=Lipingzhangella rawalii TaxID=2055835 RepID=A0ABU2H197_9ACTN|nr:MFS transporter [Lipingzhangella rawalii]MDS1269077.1 MFS transporter [Lipingzhangella rawalii]
MSSSLDSSLGRRFWQLWGSSTISNLADGMYRVSLPLIALHYTRSPTLIALVTVLATLPWLLLALHAGAIADRLDRRRIMVSANGLRLAALATFATSVALGIDSLWLLLVLALIVGTGEVFFDGTAQSILPMLVERDQLGRANGRLFAARETMESFAGQALGGVLVAVTVVAAVATPAALYGVSALILLLLAGHYRPHRGPATTLRSDIAAGIAYLWRHRVLRTLAVMTGVMNLGSSAFMAVFVLYAVGPESAMGLPEYAYGWLLMGTAAGSVLGALVTERLQAWLGRAQLLAATVVVSALAKALPAATANLLLVAAGFISFGVGLMMWNVVAVSLRQRIIPAELLGRVNSCYRLVAWGTLPLGALLGGLLAELLGLRGLFLASAASSLALLVCFATLTERALTAAEQDSPSSTQP